ncbi:oligopeptide/dipeptide ABC transporter ATP-binding protein [Lapillicoccus sp.]|uniref:ABC transporter ATP-binding protein n=1 Tax=Lapillicoccus sp. TaxID=1909287 RepID=UPI0027CA9AA3|nr:ATP-binding cassette domain-containing protein [Actinomycetota bacterium]
MSDLMVHIPVRLGMRRALVRAVDGVSFTVERGRTLGLVGESGCGKSTTARAVMRLEEPTSGTIRLLDQDVTHLSGEALRRTRRHFQMVFQDPYSALNPRLTVGQIVAEPMQAQGLPRAQVTARVEELLDLVGLQPRHRYAFPHQFSGGQRQRIGTARALSTHPELLILDEPVSALDVSVQAQVVNLFRDLQDQFDMGMIFISHDLSVVRHVSDDVVVMYLGQIVEQGPSESVLTNPHHPYTEALISAAPGRAGTADQRERIVLTGEVPSPIDPPAGCRFRSRCWKATEECKQTPPLAVPDGGAHPVACFHPSI